MKWLKLWGVSFQRAQKQLTLLNEKQSLTELRVNCAVAEKWVGQHFNHIVASQFTGTGQ
jgi:hypothetical protein